MIQFRVYLRAELGKLRNRGDAEDCVQKIGRSLIKFGLRDNAPDLAELLHSQEAVDSFVAELTDEHAQHLTEVCSKCWRNNDVFDKLQLSTSWQEDDIPVERIKLQQSEPYLGDLFCANDYWLSAIATDERILSSKPYCEHRAGEQIAYPVCLARAESSTFRIFDGMHRAIQLVRNGSYAIRLCYCPERGGV